MNRCVHSQDVERENKNSPLLLVAASSNQAKNDSSTREQIQVFKYLPSKIFTMLNIKHVRLDVLSRSILFKAVWFLQYQFYYI